MFARSAVRMARYDVSPHLTKWWKGVRPDNGQVSLFSFAHQNMRMVGGGGEFCRFAIIIWGVTYYILEAELLID